jgi:tryptophan synthase alpha subunit
MAAEIAAICDGVIIGSKLLQIAVSDSTASGFPQVRTFLSEIKSALGGCQ